MGMAGGAFEGDRERARLRLQQQQIANARAAQEAQQRHQEAVLAENARQADMADARAHRAMDLQEMRLNPQPQEQQRTSPVFSNADMLLAARQRANDRRLASLEGQNAIRGQFDEVVGMEKRQQEAKKRDGQATMASLMKMAMANGGVAPMSALNLANRRFGFDGRTRAIGAAGFTQNGDWFIDFLQKDQNGQIQRQTQTLPFDQQGRVFYGQAGIFDDADRAAWRKGMLERRYSTDEVNTLSGLDATMIGGLDDEGRARLDAGSANPVQKEDWKRELAFRKQELMEQKFARSLGQKSLDAAQKYALYHFKEFAGVRKATEADVQAGRAKSVGEMFMSTPQMQFDDAVQFYKDNMANRDPALNPGEGGKGAVEAPVGESQDKAVQELPQAAPGGEAPAEGVDQPTDARFGLRNDGKTYKGTGWLGVLKLPNGGVASEYTVGVEINGKEIDIPTLVPTLTKAEQDQMVNDIIPNNKEIPDAIMKKAVDFAKMRIANGRSVFANDGQAPTEEEAPAAAPANGEAAPAESAPAESAEEPSEPPKDPHGTTRGYGHVIQGDDDLVSVAIKYTVSPSEIADLNGIKIDGDKIPELPVGTRLKLPDGAVGAKPLPPAEEPRQQEFDFGGGEEQPAPAPANAAEPEEEEPFTGVAQNPQQALKKWGVKKSKR